MAKKKSETFIARMGRDGKPDCSDIKPLHISKDKMESIDRVRGRSGLSEMETIAELANLLRQEKTKALTEGIVCPECGWNGIAIFFYKDENGGSPHYECRRCETKFDVMKKYEYYNIRKGDFHEKSGDKT